MTSREITCARIQNPTCERYKMKLLSLISLCLLLLLSSCVDNKEVGKKTIQTSTCPKETKANSKIIFLEDDKEYQNFALVRFYEDVSSEKIKPFLNEIGVSPLKNHVDTQMNLWGVQVVQQEVYKVPGHELRTALRPLSKSNLVRYIVVRAPLPVVEGPIPGVAVIELNYDAYTNYNRVKKIEPFLESKGVYLITILGGILVRYDESTYTFSQLIKEISDHGEIKNVRPEQAGRIKPLE